MPDARTTGARAPPSSVGRPLRWLSRGGDCCTGQYPPGADLGIADCLVPAQGPNYALAKRVQRWRAALTCREAARSPSTSHLDPDSLGGQEPRPGRGFRRRAPVRGRGLRPRHVQHLDGRVAGARPGRRQSQEPTGRGRQRIPGRTRRTPRCTAVCGARRTSLAAPSASLPCWVTPAPGDDRSLVEPGERQRARVETSRARQRSGVAWRYLMTTLQLRRASSGSRWPM